MNAVVAILHVLVACLVVVAAVAEIRWVWTKSRLLGLITALGTVIRLVSAVALFAISYFSVPLLRSLQAGNGFWTLAPDAVGYFHIAADAAKTSIFTIPSFAPSPAYLRLLALWLFAVGPSVPAALLFNVVCYLATVAVIIKASSELELAIPSVRNGVALVLGAISFSPMLLLTSTQVLKDSLVMFLIAATSVLAYALFRNVVWRGTVRRVQVASTTVALAVAIAATAGIRPYFAVTIWIAIAAGLVTTIRIARRGHRAMAVAGALAVLVVLWASVIAGAGSYYAFYADMIARTVGINVPIVLEKLPEDVSLSAGNAGPQAMGATLASLREGFAHSEGGTNMAFRETSRSKLDAVKGLGVGLLATFVPMHLLSAVSVVTFHGGAGGLVAVADADTIFMDGSLFLATYLVFRRRRWLATAAPLLFTGVLIATTALLLAYVVTNFGTLLRLRLLVIGPWWLWPLAFDRNASLAANGRDCGDQRGNVQSDFPAGNAGSDTGAGEASTGASRADSRNPDAKSSARWSGSTFLYP